MSNLPPGVTEGMIPGNRPEDMEFEQIVEKLIMDLHDFFRSSNYLDERDTPDILDAVREDFDQAIKEKG